jgi:hypothetical protein
MSAGYCEKCGKKSALSGKCFNPECAYVTQLEAVAEAAKEYRRLGDKLGSYVTFDRDNLRKMNALEDFELLEVRMVKAGKDLDEALAALEATK